MISFRKKKGPSHAETSAELPTPKPIEPIDKRPRVSVASARTALKLGPSMRDAVVHLRDGQELVGRARLEGVDRDVVHVVSFEGRAVVRVPLGDVAGVERVEDWLADKHREVSRSLESAGYPATSEAWDEALDPWLRSATTWFVGRCGRRAGKGLNACKLAVTFAEFCPLVDLPPGERAFIQFLSVDRDEAANRLRMVEAMLEARHVRYSRRGDEIDLLDRAVTIRVSTASIRGVVGRSTILVIEDEVSRWRDSDGSANPAKEIHASIGPSMASQPYARGLVLSAPFSEINFHAQLFDRGNTETQRVFHAPTWRGNPTISEERTRQLEPDPATWSREYAAVPVAGITSICSSDEHAAVTSHGFTRKPRPFGRTGIVWIFVDPGFTNDAFAASAWCRELRTGANGQIVDTIVQLGILHLKPTFLSKVKIKDAIDELDRFCNEYGATELYGDFHYAEAIAPAMQERGKRYTVLPQTSQALTKRVENLRARIYSQSIDLLDHAEQTKELLQAQLVAHSGGRLTLRAPERRGAHDDLVSCILLACDVEGATKLPPCESDVIVRPGAINFAPGEGLSIGRTKYYRRLPNGGLQEREPPFGSRAFITYAVESVTRGEWTEAIERWCRELGHEPHPSIDPQKLDPQASRREPF